MEGVIDISSTDSEDDRWENDDDLDEEINELSHNYLYNDSVSDVHDIGHYALVDDPCPSTEYRHKSSPLNRVSDFTEKTCNGSILASFGQTRHSGSNCKQVFDDTVEDMGNGNTQLSTYEGTMPPLKRAAIPGNSSEQQAGDFGDCIRKEGIEPSKEDIQRRTLPPSFVPIVHPKGGMHLTVNGDNSTSWQSRGSFSKDSCMASQKTMSPGGDADAQHHDNIDNSDHEPWHATDNKQKRILSSSFQPSISKTVPKPSLENNDDIQVLGIFPKLGTFREPKLTMLSTSKFGIKDNIDRRDLHIQVHENAGAHRQLPPWMNEGSASRNVAFSSAMSSSSIYSDSTRDHSGIGEKSMEEDERLVFQAALQDLAQPKNEIDLPAGFLTVPLLRHQRIALSWMKRKESSSHCPGGILADDQGLGKTVSVIALIQMERPDQVQFSRGFSNFIRPDALNLDEVDHTLPEDKKTRPSEKHLEGKPQNGPSSNHSSHTESNFFNLVEIDDEQHALDRDAEEDLEANTKFEASGLDKHYHPVHKMKETGHSADCNSSKKVPAKSRVKCMMHKGRPTGGTLVVCPATILRQWARELDEKVPDDKKLSVLIYHGSSRSKDPTYLAKHDVVLTTYAIVTNEVPKQPLSVDEDVEERNTENYALSSDFSLQRKRKMISDVHKGGKVKKKGASDSGFDFQSGPLARVRWFRVVLDEAQTIKNFRTQVSRACCGLRAKRRWCLSGTPLQNSLDDLYSYFRFLKCDPYAAYSKFVSSIKTPIFRNATTGYKKLQVILRTIMLRRTKATLIDGEPIIRLPPKVIFLKKICFSPDEREFYSNLEADSRQKFKVMSMHPVIHMFRSQVHCRCNCMRKMINNSLVYSYCRDLDKRVS
ncbi:hypothetical protein Taro_009430 [Colocasia esculenta]|uniref:Helicase ATP-binding domain-containing protein n=1 Tax=Colocasia esculenta TaxID=4460 RepID=A0A843U9Y1_COLES|nr:hypothetical protein [Colocasia esculenta]